MGRGVQLEIKFAFLIIFSQHFCPELKVDIFTGVQQYKVNSVSKWTSPYDDCIRVTFLEKLKTTEAHEYAYEYE